MPPSLINTLVALLGGSLLLRPCWATHPPSWNLDYLKQEVDFLASQRHRLTGSPSHNAFIDRIILQLEQLGLTVHVDTLNFTYFNGPLLEPSLKLGGEHVPVTSYSKYSGFTSRNGESGKLVDVTTNSIYSVPVWSKARGGIALANLTNFARNGNNAEDLWPGSSLYSSTYGSPEASAEKLMRNLGDAARAGVKGVVWAWQGAATGLVDGIWSPFHNLYQGVPTLFVQGGHGGLEKLRDAAQAGTNATLTLYAQMVPNTSSRTLWVVFEGTTFRNESLIINTHTDGTNTIEENGYIALMAHARELVATPPKRTTILVFVGQHLQYEAFNPSPFKATSRWLSDHPEYWAGQGNTDAFKFGGQLKAVAGTCVEHMGAVHWAEDVSKDTYLPTNTTEPETLYAATPELDALLRQYWHGAKPNITRVTNPSARNAQGGEGYPYFLYDIPNISLVTDPAYLLKIWPGNFDTTALVDLQAMQRQIQSFTRLWRVMDGMYADQFGQQSNNGSSTALHIGPLGGETIS